jgi:4-carboxymuconolactone decarboxylase
MDELTTRDLELVALGAALGSNCASCVEYHIQEALRAGLSPHQIRSAIAIADRIRQVPAGKALEAAQQTIDRTGG